MNKPWTRHGQGKSGSTGIAGNEVGGRQRERERERIEMYDIYKWSKLQQLIGFVVGDGSNNSRGHGNAFS